VDTLKSGSRDTIVTGIVTSMFPTIAVIRQAIAANANFIICHEPSYYNHLDETDWLQGDEVYKYKRALLDTHGIAIWRNHDYIHTHNPDGVFKTIIEQLGWQQQLDEKAEIIRLNTPLALSTLIAYAKKKLGISMLRYIGNPAMLCKNV